jgi:four helix bundle protein
MDSSNQNEFRTSLQKRLIKYSLDVIHLLNTLPRSISSIEINKQLIRSATSIGANFTEAQAASSKKEFTNFLRIALKSAHETRYWFILISELNIDNKAITQLLKETNEIIGIFTAIVKKLSS